MEVELEFEASPLPLMSALMAFHCVSNFVVVNLVELMDRINEEISPLPRSGSDLVHPAEWCSDAQEKRGGNKPCTSSLQTARGRRAPAPGLVFWAAELSIRLCSLQTGFVVFIITSSLITSHHKVPQHHVHACNSLTLQLKSRKKECAPEQFWREQQHWRNEIQKPGLGTRTFNDNAFEHLSFGELLCV